MNKDMENLSGFDFEEFNLEESKPSKTKKSRKAAKPWTPRLTKESLGTTERKIDVLIARLETLQKDILSRVNVDCPPGVFYDLYRLAQTINRYRVIQTELYR